ncbi:hypothetical protein PIB30_075928 [Stylosanthes scabra]|uniref:Uncharacterized protein n=1 Tax=Stylosanthes scabra TaxID=79078 RepID=A0ABU6TT28_9FABA|nr:hypothetical protein [Stylosanthes scabra]
MSRRGKQTATGDATPLRARSSRNSSRGRDEGFLANRFEHQIHFDRWKGLENRDIVHERIVRLDGDEHRIFQECLLGLGWGFMYDDLVHINVTVPLNIPGDALDADVDDAFVTFVKTYVAGGDLNMEAIYAEIGREDTNWADNPAVNLIPKNMNNSILNLELQHGTRSSWLI